MATETTAEEIKEWITVNRPDIIDFANKYKLENCGSGFDGQYKSLEVNTYTCRQFGEVGSSEELGKKVCLYIPLCALLDKLAGKVTTELALSCNFITIKNPVIWNHYTHYTLADEKLELYMSFQSTLDPDIKYFITVKVPYSCFEGDCKLQDMICKVDIGDIDRTGGRVIQKEVTYNISDVYKPIINYMKSPVKLI